MEVKVMNVYDYILAEKKAGRRLLAVLTDPDKGLPPAEAALDRADLLFVGGSTGSVSDEYMAALRCRTTRPIVLFPGNLSQINEQADALLFLSLMNSRDAEMLVGRHIRVAERLIHSPLEVIPMGYILIDGGKISSVARVSQSEPLAQNRVEDICHIAAAAELLGKKLVYLEAGSGADQSVSADIVRAVKATVSVPMIVGGGIRTMEKMQELYRAGADIIVIGNHFEQHPEQINLFADGKNG